MPTAATSFDPYDPAFLADPYPTYARLREGSPIFHDDAWGLVFLTRHRDVNAILRDRRFGRDVHHALDVSEVDPDLYRRIYPPEYPVWTRTIRGSFIDLEPPRHTEIRRLVNKAFTRRASETYRPAIRATARRLVERLLDAREVDAIRDYATPLPVQMITDLLAIPAADHPRLLRWSHAIVRLFDADVPPEDGAAAERAVAEFSDYVRDLLAERRRRPGDDLVSAMLQVEDEGRRLDEQDIVNTTILTLNAGHEATVHAIGNGLKALHDVPEAYAALRSDPERLAPAAADELLRFDSPLQMFERWVLEDVEWDGVPLRKGTKVGLLFGAANRDPEAFDEPDRIRFDRGRNPHVAFGAGIHYCVGAPLATVELEEAFAAFASGVRSFEVTTDRLEHHPSLIFRGLTALPLAISPA